MREAVLALGSGPSELLLGCWLFEAKLGNLWEPVGDYNTVLTVPQQEGRDGGQTSYGRNPDEEPKLRPWGGGKE